MITFGKEAGANPRILSLLHATRVLIIVSIAPVLVTQFYGVSLSNPIGQPASDMPVLQLVLMFIAAIVGWKGGEKLGLFGASILGPMILAAAFSLGGLLQMRPPAEAILVAQFFIGTGIGIHYVGVTVRELRHIIAAGAAFMLILAALAALFAQIVTTFGLAAPVEAFLSFAPGGQAEMTVLAIVAGADLGFVIAHHLVRIVLVITGAPLIGRFMNRRRSRRLD